MMNKNKQAKNLADPEFKKIIEELKKGKQPKGIKAVKRVYKHPVERRTTLVSNGQYKGVRHGK